MIIATLVENATTSPRRVAAGSPPSPNSAPTDGSFTVGKAITRRDDEPRSYRESVLDAAHNIGVGADLGGEGMGVRGQPARGRCGAEQYVGAHIVGGETGDGLVEPARSVAHPSTVGPCRGRGGTLRRRVPSAACDASPR